MINDFIPYIIGSITITISLLTYISTSNDRRRRWELDNMNNYEKKINELEAEIKALKLDLDNAIRQKDEWADMYRTIARRQQNLPDK